MDKMDKLEMVAMIAERLNSKYPEGEDPFKIISRIAEECGEVAKQINHYEKWDISLDKDAKDNKEELVSELVHVLIASYQLLGYFNLEKSFEDQIISIYENYKMRGLI